VREHNEDSLLVKPPLYVIADGMGGHAAGEVASECAVQVFEQAAITRVDPDALRRAVIEANNAIIQGAREGLGKVGMGTTLTAALIENDHLLIAQVGDSRAYLLQKGRLNQVTRDHSFVAELLSSGQITAEEARVHPERSVITRALGSDPNLQPDIYELRVHTGDRLMLCSDGLSSMLDARTLQRLLSENPDPQTAADELVKAANEAGGHDNITVIVVDVDAMDPRLPVRQKRRFVWGITLFLLALVLLVAGAAAGVYAYARNAVFLIAEDGYVAIYQGLPGDVMGFRLRWLKEKTDIPATSLPPTMLDSLQEGEPYESESRAQEIIAPYRQKTEKATEKQ
jgi:protein phosphatase